MNKYIDLLRLKINNYIVIDDFFPDGMCTYLRDKTLNSEYYDNTFMGGYQALNFDYEDYKTDSLKDISDKYIIPKISLANKYSRAWSFVYDNVSRGICPHADPSFINVNIWVTPDECVYDHNKNGLILYRKKCPKDWDWETYNRDLNLIEDFLKGSKYDRIPYKCNRAVIFRGETFHSTDSVYMKPGPENKRVNYTFLYDG